MFTVSEEMFETLKHAREKPGSLRCREIDGDAPLESFTDETSCWGSIVARRIIGDGFAKLPATVQPKSVPES